MTIDSFKGRIHHGIKIKNKKEEKGGQYDGWYRVLGYLWVFIVWFYECCPTMVNTFCKSGSSRIPRILNWSSTIVTKNPTLRDLKGKIFDLPLNKVIVSFFTVFLLFCAVLLIFGYLIDFVSIFGFFDYDFQLKIKNICPTTEERQKLQLEGFL